MSNDSIRDLIERSSLGATDALVLAHRADPDRTTRVVRRSRAHLSVAPRPVPRRSLPLVLAVVAVTAALVGSIVIGMAVLGSRTPNIPVGPIATEPASAVPSPTLPPSPSPTPSPTSGPTGFAPCTVLGAAGSCPTKPECWDGFSQVYDIPAVSNRMSCSREHLYQTIVAGRLDGAIRTQSQLEANPEVRSLCREDVILKRLGRDRLPDVWQIEVLPPPSDRDDLFRCILFAGGYRALPLELAPR